MLLLQCNHHHATISCIWSINNQHILLVVFGIAKLALTLQGHCVEYSLLKRVLCLCSPLNKSEVYFTPTCLGFQHPHNPHQMGPTRHPKQPQIGTHVGSTARLSVLQQLRFSIPLRGHSPVICSTAMKAMHTPPMQGPQKQPFAPPTQCFHKLKDCFCLSDSGFLTSADDFSPFCVESSAWL